VASRETRRPHISTTTTQPAHFGQGWISGVFSVFLGILGLGTVICFHFPSLLTMPELRTLYPVPWIRAALHLTLLMALLLGAISVCLRYNKALGAAGITLAMMAWLLGGSGVSVNGGELRNGPFLGLDWLLLNLIGYSVIFVPIERLFPLHPEQPVFRRQWRVDMIYFAVSALLVQMTTLLTMRPAMVLFDWARNAWVSGFVKDLPFAAQFLFILILSDLTQYWVHRWFHVMPFLWRFHSIHHSAEVMDWLAGSRLHLIDAVITRAISYVPIYVLGFSEQAMFAYVAWVVIQATFIHSNVRWKFRWLQPLLATPAFHHWHHSAAPEAVDKNFAVHLPVLDRIFGSYYLPDRWPESYGLAPDSPPVPEGFVSQFVYPLAGAASRQPD
jgi:sterol desaturase/sphingolipid hydroxylase (fatty acid hydroxylase superfamily)